MSDSPITLITGTRKGIGRFLAEHYAAQGHTVIGCSRSPIDWELEGYTHHIVDVHDEPAVKALFSSIRRQYKRLDNLINNAGVAAMNHSMMTPISQVENVLATNFTGTFLFAREASKLMKKNNYGRIVNFSTVASPLKLEGEAVYASSKSAVLTLTEILARELAEFGITVNAIGPTPIETDLIAAVPKNKIDELIERQGIKRRGEMTDVSNVIDFFLQRESNFVTGQKLFLGGV